MTVPRVMDADARADGPEERALSFLGRTLPEGFVLQVITIEPGASRPFHEKDWCDALVVVEQGRVTLAASAGRTWHFVRGDVVFLTGLPLRALHNQGDEPVVLSAVRRQRPPSGTLPCR